MIEDEHRAGQARRPRPEQFLGSPNPQRCVLDHEHQGEGCKQLEKFGCMVDAAQQHHFYHRTDDTHQQRGEQQRRPEPRAGAEPIDHRIGDVDAQHVQGAVREVDDARDTENQRKPGAYEEQR